MNRTILFAVFLLSSWALAATKVACVGNSITYGYGLNSPYYESYPSQLQNQLGSAYAVSNFGISSRTMLKKGDQPYWNESAYTQALALLPDITVIKLGTNDAKLALNWTPHKAEFESDYSAMIQSFRSLSSNPNIFICQIVPAYQTIWDISDTTIREEVNPKILNVALNEGVNLIDLYQAMSNKPSLFISDGIHPNAAGAAELAKYVYQAITYKAPDIAKSNNLLSVPAAAGYQWYRDGVRIDSASGGTKQTLTYSAAGTYKVSVKLSDSCNTRIVSNPITVSAYVPTLGGGAPSFALRYLGRQLLVSGLPMGQKVQVQIFQWNGRRLWQMAVGADANGQAMVDMSQSHLPGGVKLFSVSAGKRTWQGVVSGM